MNFRSVMKNFFHLSLAILAILSVSCSEADRHPSDLPEPQRKRIESAVINRFNALTKYAEAGELENMLTYFDASGPGSYIDGSIRYASFQDMVDSYRASWRVRKQDYGIPETRIYVLSPDFALVTSTATVQTTSRDGIEFQPRPSAVSTLWRLTDGQWLIHSFQQFLPAPVPVEVKEPD